jgi:hypothetical protein
MLSMFCIMQYMGSQVKVREKRLEVGIGHRDGLVCGDRSPPLDGKKPFFSLRCSAERG